MTTTSPARTNTAFTGLAALSAWVADAAEALQPDRVEWYAGGDEAFRALLDGMVDRGELIRLDPVLRPGSFLARSSEDDVARVEDRTFICSEREQDAGPTNNWRDPAAMRAELADRFAGAMRGRTMHVVPFSMGPLGGPISQVGVQITDSPYVVASTAIMTRAGTTVLDAIGRDTAWVPAMHTVGAPLAAGEPDVPWPSNAVKVIAHFPETREIWSYGSGYGGNALLAKKCFALRIASVMARDEGWLAEHMLLIRVTTPEGRAHHLAGAFPSACGKTNLAMLQPTLPGWRVETLGDDIVWIRPGEDGRLMAMNPEAGFFGVAPGTGPATNPAALEAVAADTIFTNVALTPEGDVWWEGLTDEPPAGLIDWRGRPWSADSGQPAAHPNARFTTPIDRCPTLAPGWDSHAGVPLDAIVFGGRRATTVPLVAQAEDWAHGVFFGATVASERTAAAEGRVGELRFDPFAMLPFCGYDMADYFGHWLRVGAAAGDAAPPVFRVNWFRKDERGRFLWPGFGENVRVLEWIVRRLEGAADAVATAAGDLPAADALDAAAAGVSDDDLARALAVDPGEWRRECDAVEALFDRFDDRVPAPLRARLARTREALRPAAAASPGALPRGTGAAAVG